MDAEGTAWGSYTSLADYLTFIRYLRRVGLTNIYVLCQSMGGLDALRLAGRVRIRAWAGIYPLANLSSIDAGSRPAIESTLGDAFARYWQTLSPAPIRFPAGLRVILWSGYGDTVVPRAENTDVIAAAARREGARVRVVTTTGNHGDPSNFEPATLVRFFETRLGAGHLADCDGLQKRFEVLLGRSSNGTCATFEQVVYSAFDG